MTRDSRAAARKQGWGNREGTRQYRRMEGASEKVRDQWKRKGRANRGYVRLSWGETACDREGAGESAREGRKAFYTENS